MARNVFLLLPLVGIAAADFAAFDYHAPKYAALMVAALAGLGVAIYQRRFAWTSLALVLWAFVAVRGTMLLRSPLPGEAVRWWGLLLALAFWHHAACGLASRARYARMVTPLFAAPLLSLALSVRVKESAS